MSETNWGDVQIISTTTTGNTTTWTQLDRMDFSHDSPPYQEIEVKFESEENQVNKKRKLYDVYFVDPEGNNGDGEVVEVQDEVIAEDSEGAIRKAIAKSTTLEKDLEDYDILVHDLCDVGSIRPKKR
jgi:hypothetical protein